MKQVLIVFPTGWDAKQLDACRRAWDGRFQVELAEPTDSDCPWDFDIVRYIEETARERRGAIAGITSSSDYPGATVAAAIATRLGLPGSQPETVIRSSHKYYSRLVQRQAAPEATPWFALVDPQRPQASADLEFPCFVKPVKGAFSVMSRRIDSHPELVNFVQRPALREFLDSYLDIFNQLVRQLTRLEIDGRFFLAEQLLHGTLVTVEGFSYQGEIEILGVVDSVVQPGTGSFLRFDYPSELTPSVQSRMAGIARRVISQLGLDNCLFNIEMIYDPASDRIGIIEVNPRICGQFADLYQKVDGTNGYEVALALAIGARPLTQRGNGRYRFASSFPLRIFEPARVSQAPGPTEIEAAEALYPETMIWSECAAGELLSDFESIEDGQSYRYAVINLGAAQREELQDRCAAVRARLGYRFEPI